MSSLWPELLFIFIGSVRWLTIDSPQEHVPVNIVQGRTHEILSVHIYHLTNGIPVYVSVCVCNSSVRLIILLFSD